MGLSVLAAILALFLPFGAVAAEGDAAAGAKVYNKCKACHQVGEKAKNRIGPLLNGIVGRKAATVKGFKYSKALQKKSSEGLVWDAAALDQFLLKPRKFVPKTRMSFGGLKKPDQRADVIAYLMQFNKDGSKN